MKNYNSAIHHRASIRLKGYDYGQSGFYFVTICTQGRALLFGKITNGIMYLNEAGKFVDECWLAIPNHYPKVILHNHVIMPNHVHGIIEFIKGNYEPTDIPHPNIPHPNIVGSNDVGANNHSPLRSPSKTVGSVVRGFKIGVTKWFRSNTKIQDVWQRNYYEIIIRDQIAYQNISLYISNNPEKWESDSFYSKYK